MSDRDAIRDLIDSWVPYRDAGDWKRVREVFHNDGRVNATWRQAGAAEFIEASREGMELGVSILHFLGGTTIDFAGDRAVSQTKMTIAQRAEVDGVPCDVVCTGRFVDFWTGITTGLVDTFRISQLLGLVVNGRLDPSLFATHRFALGDTLTAYDTFADAVNTGALKVVLKDSDTGSGEAQHADALVASRQMEVRGSVSPAQLSAARS